MLFFTYFLFFSKKLFLQKDINNFNLKFGLINLIAFFPIILALLLSVNIYDNLRLFLFIIPFFGRDCIVFDLRDEDVDEW